MATSSIDPSLRHSTFPNGVRVVTLNRPHMRSAAVGICIRNGVRHQRPDQNGFAHLFEHLLFKGNRRLNQIQLARAFEALGGQINAFTGRELTLLHGRASASEILDLTGLFCDMLVNVEFNDRDIRVEAQVTRRELASQSMEDALEEQALAQIWPNHPFGYPVIGDPDVLAGADASQVQAYLQEALKGERILIVAVGNVDHEQLKQVCGPLSRLASGRLPETSSAPFAPTHWTLDYPGDEAQLMWMMPLPVFSWEVYPTALIANHILGGGVSSRLFRELREKQGLAYGVHSNLETYTDTGLWLVRTACDPAQAQECRHRVEQVIAGMIDTGPTLEEMQSARRHLSATLQIEYDDLDAMLERIITELIYLGQVPTVDEYETALSRVTPDDVVDMLGNAWANKASGVWLPK